MELKPHPEPLPEKMEREKITPLVLACPELLPPHSRCCLCPARPRFAPGVTIEEDNCCGCNAIAIRRHFLDENMTAVDIVYTSCHDAVRNQAGAQGPLEATGDQATKDTPQASGVSYGFQIISSV